MSCGRAVVMFLMVVASVTVAPARADAVTLKEIMELTKSGVGDEVIVALIEIEQRVFPIDSETLSMLKKAGVSDRVMVAIVKSGRTAPPTPPPAPLAQDPVDEPSPPPQVYVVEREPSIVREVVVPVPVYVGVATRRGGHDGGRSRSSSRSSYDNIRTPFTPFGPLPSISLQPAPKPKPAEPVYWGWGGKRRPDTWDPDPQPGKKK